MKKRTFKKWIPKDTIYCYYDGKYHGRSGDCKFYTENKNAIDEQREHGWFNEGYCKMLNVEIFDRCKACDVGKSGWFRMSDYKGLSSHYFKKEREWKRKHPGNCLDIPCKKYIMFTSIRWHQREDDPDYTFMQKYFPFGSIHEVVSEDYPNEWYGCVYTLTEIEGKKVKFAHPKETGFREWQWVENK